MFACADIPGRAPNLARRLGVAGRRHERNEAAAEVSAVGAAPQRGGSGREQPAGAGGVRSVRDACVSVRLGSRSLLWICVSCAVGPERQK